MAKPKIKITERGWAGHFICGPRCRFHRNTLLTKNGKHIVVSTVGAYFSPMAKDGDGPDEIGFDRHYETMAFIGEKRGHYLEMSVGKEVNFNSPWSLKMTKQNEEFIDNLANEMHDNVVDEVHDNFDDYYEATLKNAY